MCFKDLIEQLQREGINLTMQQVCWAFRSGAVSKPRKDGAGRFVYEKKHVEELRKLAKIRRPITRKAA